MHIDNNSRILGSVDKALNRDPCFVYYIRNEKDEMVALRLFLILILIFVGFVNFMNFIKSLFHKLTQQSLFSPYYWKDY